MYLKVVCLTFSLRDLRIWLSSLYKSFLVLNIQYLKSFTTPKMQVPNRMSWLSISCVTTTNAWNTIERKMKCLHLLLKWLFHQNINIASLYKLWFYVAISSYIIQSTLWLGKPWCVNVTILSTIQNKGIFPPLHWLAIIIFMTALGSINTHKQIYIYCVINECICISNVNVEYNKVLYTFYIIMKYVQ